MSADELLDRMQADLDAHPTATVSRETLQWWIGQRREELT
jgi:hypothetical protein